MHGDQRMMIHGDPCMGHSDPRMGHDDPRMGQDDPRMGHGDPHLGHGDPRMGHNDPRMGHCHPGMMFRGPRMWMFRHMMNSASSEDEKSRSEAEEKVQKRCQMKEKRQKFRKIVQEIGVRPWMFRILAHEIYGKKPDEATSADDVTEDGKKGRKNEKREKYLQTLREIGAQPWMFRVLANQRARAEGEAPPEAAAVEGRPDRMEMRQRRKKFRQMAKQQLGWTSDSDGDALTDGEDEKKEEKERRKEERQKMRKMMREMGWMPWMMGRWRHHHNHHHHSPGRHAEFLSNADKSGDEQDDTKRDEKRERMKKEKREKVQKFQQVVQEMGVHPWMFKILGREIFGKGSDAATSGDETIEDGKKGRKNEKREKHLQTLKEIGAQPWMFRVLANQRARAEKKGSDSDGETQPEGADVAMEGIPDRMETRQRRKTFRQMVKQMGRTSDLEMTSDGDRLTDGEKGDRKEEKKEEKERRREEKQGMRKVMREMGWMPWMMGRGRHHHHNHHSEEGAPHMMGGCHHHHGHHHDHDDHHHKY